MTKILMINENTIIKLYNKLVWDGCTDLEISCKIVNEIRSRLANSKSNHPLKTLYTQELGSESGELYELAHYVYSTVEDHVKATAFIKKIDKK